MYKVKINYCNDTAWYDDEPIYTELPQIPKKNDGIGFWHEKEWTIGTVQYVIYELDENNKFMLAEINVSF